MSPVDHIATLERTSGGNSDLLQSQPEGMLPTEGVNTKAPKIFLSFASEDSVWVDWFIRKEWFGGKIGAVTIENYLAGDNLVFGHLKKWIEERINEATVVVAFISEAYRQKDWTQAEWNTTLNEFQRRRLIFVPIMMDSDAKSWWQELRQQGRLSALPIDYMYSDFTDHRGQPISLSNDVAAQMKIVKVALAIKDLLFTPPRPPQRKLDPGPQPVSKSTDLIVLGHPTNRLADNVAAKASELASAARGEGLSVLEWKDGWRTNVAARGDTGRSHDASAVFVQPLAPGDAAEQVAEIGKTATRLKAVGIAGAPLVLWLPKGQDDPVFEQAASPSTEALPIVSALRTKPSLRTDPPRDLALWLRAILRATQMHDDPVVQIETVGCPEGKPDPEAAILSDALSQCFGDIVNEVVTTESTSPWLFWDNQFQAQIKRLPGSRAIVAVHDLNVPPSANETLSRQYIELKFQQMQEEVQKADSSGKLRFFWAALLCRTAKALPFARYPGGRFKDWRLLSFERTGEGPRPNPASLGAFRSQLSAWAYS